MPNTFKSEAEKILDDLNTYHNNIPVLTKADALSRLTTLHEEECLYEVTKQKLGDHEYTVLYDKQGNKYLMLEKFELNNQPPKFDNDGIVDIKYFDFTDLKRSK